MVVMEMREHQKVPLKNSLSVIVGIALLLTALFICSALVAGGKQPQAEEAEAVEVMQPKTVQVTLERVYLDGETSEEIIEETIWSMEDFWAQYDGWSLVDQSKDEMVFRQMVNDISPLMKINGYFGLTDEGILSIYDGEPDQQKIIHSFFQLDTSKLESKQHSDLEKGIPVKDRHHYEEVLEAFRQYQN